MSDVSLTVAEDRRGFAPLEVIRGTASWCLEAAPDSAEVRLFYFTRGKGSRDVRVVSTASLANPLARDDRSFTFLAPEQPHSFSGRLITLVWALELVVEPGPRSCRVELVVAPAAREIRLFGEGVIQAAHQR